MKPPVNEYAELPFPAKLPDSDIALLADPALDTENLFVIEKASVADIYGVCVIISVNDINDVPLGTRSLSERPVLATIL
jgi:hypothetical protein